MKVWANFIPIILSFIGYNSLWGANMAFRKSVLKKEPFKVNFLEDYELGIRLTERGYKTKFTGKIKIKVSSRRFSKSFHRLCFKEYILNAIRIRIGEKPKEEYWKNK